MRYLLILFTLCLSQASANSLTTIGWIEPVRIMPEGFNLEAKIDTGADNSSVDVREWESYFHNDEEWIRFKVPNNAGDFQTFERPLERYALIKRKKAESVRRPVVKMWLCIGSQRIQTSVNLSKRKDFKYRMLIGRSFLKGRYLVDSAAKRTQSSKCDLI